MTIPNKISTFEEYIASLPGKKEVMEFDTPNEAYEYGNKLRENVAKEQGVKHWSQVEGISIDISNTVVRIKVLAQELACV